MSVEVVRGEDRVLIRIKAAYGPEVFVYRTLEEAKTLAAEIRKAAQ